MSYHCRDRGIGGVSLNDSRSLSRFVFKDSRLSASIYKVFLGPMGPLLLGYVQCYSILSKEVCDLYYSVLHLQNYILLILSSSRSLFSPLAYYNLSCVTI